MRPIEIANIPFVTRSIENTKILFDMRSIENTKVVPTVVVAVFTVGATMLS
jgi:hypothetical protein